MNCWKEEIIITKKKLIIFNEETANKLSLSHLNLQKLTVAVNTFKAKSVSFPPFSLTS